jgi:hypothetical protein
MLTAYPPVIRLSGSSMITFVGIPNMSITWEVMGAGVITNAPASTDSRGVAMAKFTPTVDNQDVLVRVHYVS